MAVKELTVERKGEEEAEERSGRGGEGWKRGWGMGGSGLTVNT